jgi:hypothetical protein
MTLLVYCILSRAYDFRFDQGSVVGEEFIVMSEIWGLAGAEMAEKPPKK